jgi:beta-1,2-mannosidase
MNKKLTLLLLLISAFLNACYQPKELATNWAMLGFDKMDDLNPILEPSKELTFMDPITNQEVLWEERNVLNPTAVVKDNKVYMLYRAQDINGTSRIGMAVSNDGLQFTKMQTPVFFPENDDMKVLEWNYQKKDGETLSKDKTLFDGAEDPRIVEDENGVYFMTYTAYDGKVARLCMASSKDLTHWIKHGLVLKSDKYKDQWSKAGAIVVEQKGDKMIAKRINGKYWMYFGDTNLFMASSVDLIHWDILEDGESQNMISVLHPRKGYFDSRLVESGPYAIYTQHGILMIYNSSNSANFNDNSLPKFTYAASQVLFDKNEPYKLIDRLNHHFIHPNKDYEKEGEVNEVCFVEGLVHFKNKWFLYYVTADSKIAVAVKDK